MPTIATPQLWAVSFGILALLLLIDFIVTRKPHEVSIREATGWSIFYIALPTLFGVWVWWQHGSETAVPFYTGYLVEKALSIDNLFVFMLVLSQFAVPKELQQRVLLFGILGALVLRGLFIAAGAVFLSRFEWLFLVMAVVLVIAGVKLLKDAVSGAQEDMKVEDLMITRMVRRVMAVSSDHNSTKWLTVENGKRALTPFALVVIVVFAVDIVFAVDSVPAVYGITEDPYLVFATNAFALLGLRALYFVLDTLLSKLHHLNYGLAVILAFIGAKLALHWAHLTWPSVPEVPTMVSLIVILCTLSLVTITSICTKPGAKGPGQDDEESGRGGPAPAQSAVEDPGGKETGTTAPLGQVAAHAIDATSVTHSTQPRRA